MTMKDPALGYTEADTDTNDSAAPSLEMLAADRYSRRQAIFGGAKATSLAFMGTAMLAACDDDTNGSNGALVVSAGSSAATSSGRTVTLTGSVTAGSSTTTSARWTQVSGPAVTLEGSGASVSFIAPAVETASDLVFEFSASNALGDAATSQTTVRVSPAVLGFTAVDHSLEDLVVVPAGYSVTVMTRLGDPLTAATSAYANDGTDSDFANRIGDHADALHYFGLSAAGAPDDSANARGLMVQNHENITESYLHPNGPTTVGGARPVDEVLKEIECHGVSVAEYVDNGDRSWTYVQDSAFNRRVTPNTVMSFHGPAAGNAWLQTMYSPEGTAGRGTINNCANGVTGWHSYLTCEENFHGYFRRDTADDALRSERQLASLRRNGVTSRSGSYAWSTASSTDTRITRWNATTTSATTAATSDFRNEPFQFGWVVEMDPYDPASTPRKRTALGRFGHEGAFAQLVAGQPVGVYMGDDSRGEYLYKYVSNANFDAADADAADRLATGDKYLDNGTLYVARFNADGTGTWLPLVFGQVPARPASGSYPEYAFESQADILINCRLAGDAVGATPMDRPEWTAGNPATGEIYLTLTNSNNSNRPVDGTNAANPRSYWGAGNPNGHIIRLREDGDTTAAMTFTWDIYLFGADTLDTDTADEQANINVSNLDLSNDFSSPDGAYFSRASAPSGQFNPLFWIETDDGAMTDVTNCMLLAAQPGTVGDGGAKTITNTNPNTGATGTQATFVGASASAANLRRFLVGPTECEITGIDMTPDGRTLFVGIQHPGERGDASDITSNWPASQSDANATARPRSAVVAITKDDGGVIGL